MARCSWRDSWTAGSCSFCNRTSAKVLEVQGENSGPVNVVRICAACLQDIKKRNYPRETT